MKGKQKVIEFLEAIKKPVEGLKELFDVAMVACNYDEPLAKMLSEAVHRVGKNGMIHIEPNNTFETYLIV